MACHLDRLVGAAEVAQDIALRCECGAATRSFPGRLIRFINRLLVLTANQMQMREHNMRQSRRVVPIDRLARPILGTLERFVRFGADSLRPCPPAGPRRAGVTRRRFRIDLGCDFKVSFWQFDIARIFGKTIACQPW